jgi:hypothetical protein
VSLNQHLGDAPVSAEERRQHWAEIRRKRSRLRQRRWVLAGSAMATLVASLALGLGMRRQPPPAPAPIGVASATRFTLPDGSRVASQPGTELEVLEGTPRRVRIDLRQGTSDFEVVPNPDRPFSVLVPAAELRVVGTRFRVVVEHRSSERRIAVEVSEGVVEVRTRGSAELLSRVESGGKWTSTESPARLVASAEPSGSPSTELVSSAPHPTRSPTGDAAAALFDQATRARRSGDFERAITGYEVLLSRYPNDRHAALAALELGRLKRTRADDPHGAVAALEQAATDQELGDDALAQLVLSYDESGERERCERARTRYLHVHPNGVHVAEVRARCRGGSE